MAIIDKTELAFCDNPPKGLSPPSVGQSKDCSRVSSDTPRVVGRCGQKLINGRFNNKHKVIKTGEKRGNPTNLGASPPFAMERGHEKSPPTVSGDRV